MISTISETATVNKIELQEELYNNEEKEEKKIDTQKTIQRQMKKVFQQCKFPSDTKNQFYKPNFVTGNMNRKKSQTVQICEWIWEKIGIVDYYIYINMKHLLKNLISFLMTGKEPELPTMKDYIIFWKTYSKFIYSEFNRLRTICIRDFKNGFVKGKI